MSKVEQLTMNIDKDLKKELRKRAIDEEVTVTELLTRLIKDYLNIQK